MDRQGDFWSDANNDCVKMYSVGNPANKYDKIRVLVGDYIICEDDRSYVKYENLWLSYGGAHGIGGANTHHIIVKDCDFSYLGGRILPGYGNGFERYHGVGPMREYVLGASLFDLKKPEKEIGRLKSPLLIPNSDEREGYVPNVVYSCGSIIHNDDLIIPYAMSDFASTYATVNLRELLVELKKSD